MEPRLVIGLFQSSGIAEDARNRLKTEGVPGGDIALEVLKPIGRIPPTVAAELEALSVDPLVLGNVRETFASFIRNGETAVLVRALTDAQVEFAESTLRQYSPILVDTIPLAAGPEVVLALSDHEPTTTRNREPEPRRRAAVPPNRGDLTSRAGEPMSSSGLEVFDRTAQETNIWLGEIAEDLAQDRQVAYRVLRAVLHAIRDRLMVEQAAHLSAQLPMLIRGIYYEGYHPARTPGTARSRAEFLDVVSKELSDTRPIKPEDACEAVFNCMRRHITPGQLEKVFFSLPEPVRHILSSTEPVKGEA